MKLNCHTFRKGQMTHFVAYVFEDYSDNRDRSQFAIFLVVFLLEGERKKKDDIQNVPDYDSSY